MMLWTILIAVTIAAGAGLSFWRTRDTFHPALVLGPMLGFLYVYLPIRLEIEDGFIGFLTEEQLIFGQQLNFVGVLAFMAGIAFGARTRLVTPQPPLSAYALERLRMSALVLGALGLLAYAINIVNVGGFTEAYGRAYGGGWSDSGYVRDGVMLALPAVILLGLLRGETTLLRRVMVASLFSMPLVLQGLFGARRGPTFMAVSGIGIAYYLGRQRRPRVITILLGGAFVGLLLLFLVSNRGSIYVGSEERLDRDVGEYLRPGTGNEFIYGTGTLVHYDTTGRYMMGARYFAILFVRPIPRAVWPGKYLWVSALFDVPNLEKNLGTDAENYDQTLGWRGAMGAAPGLIADMFVEFGYGYPLALLLIGALYGLAWRRAVSGGGVWVPLFGILMSLSLYMVLQTLEAMAFRFLLTAGPTLIAWWYANRPSVPSPLKDHHRMRV